MIVLSEKLPKQERNWWVKKGGIDPEGIDPTTHAGDMICTPIMNFEALAKYCKDHLGCKETPDSLMCAAAGTPSPILPSRRRSR